jgi:hypothetical protein
MSFQIQSSESFHPMVYLRVIISLDLLIKVITINQVILYLQAFILQIVYIHFFIFLIKVFLIIFVLILKDYQFYGFIHQSKH